MESSKEGFSSMKKLLHVEKLVRSDKMATLWAIFAHQVSMWWMLPVMEWEGQFAFRSFPAIDRNSAQVDNDTLRLVWGIWDWKNLINISMEENSPLTTSLQFLFKSPAGNFFWQLWLKSNMEFSPEVITFRAHSYHLLPLADAAISKRQVLCPTVVGLGQNRQLQRGKGNYLPCL